MISRRSFLYLSVCAGVDVSAFPQSHMDAAQEFVKATQDYANQMGTSLADQDMLQITLKILMSADSVATQFRAYEQVYTATIFDLEEKTKLMLQAPDLLRGNRKELRLRYDTLKLLIRQRYEASWIPTILDRSQQDLGVAFHNAASEMEQLSRVGRGAAAKGNELVPPQPTPTPSTQIDCMFKFSTSTIETDRPGKSPGTEESVARDFGSTFFTCPGPDGDNDWIKSANYLGQGASLAASAIAIPVAAPVAIPVTIVLAALAIVSGVIGIVVSRAAIEEETRAKNEAEMYKFLHSAVPANIVEAYKTQASKNVRLLQVAAEEVRVFQSGPARQRQQLIAVHNRDRKRQEEFGLLLTRYEGVKCRINKRTSSNLPTVIRTCALETGEAGKKQEDEDKKAYEEAKQLLTIDRLWEYVRYRVLDLLIKRGSALTQDEERLAWKQLDQNLEAEFMKLMSTIEVVSDLAEIESKSAIQNLLAELDSSERYARLRHEFYSLVAEAVKVAFSRAQVDQYKKHLAQYEISVDEFLRGETASTIPEAANLHRSLLLLKQRTL